jgi:hypothetical protein
MLAAGPRTSEIPGASARRRASRPRDAAIGRAQPTLVSVLLLVSTLIVPAASLLVTDEILDDLTRLDVEIR